MAVDNGLYVDKPVTRHASLEAFTPGTVTAIQVAKASAKRQSITFISSGPNIMQIMPDSPTNANRFIQIAPGQGTLILDIERYGSLLQGPWFALSLVGAQGLAVIDVVEQ